MAAESTIELQKISDFVSQLDGLVSIQQAIVYGVDQNGKSVKITCAQLTDHTTIENRLTTVEGKAETNRTNIATIIAALPSKSDVGHTHTMSDVTDLATELNDKSDVGHVHTISDVTDLSTELSRKANAVHGHTISDVENLSTSLDNKSNVGHGHAISDVAGLQGELNNKAPLNHTHSIPEIEQLQTQIQTINSEVTAVQQDVQTIAVAAGFPQIEDLSTYTAAVGKIVQYIGETTSQYKHGYIYQYDQQGEPVAVPEGYWYRNLANGHILILANIQPSVRTYIYRYNPIVNGLAYAIYIEKIFESQTEVDWQEVLEEAAVGKMLVPCSDDTVHKVAAISVTTDLYQGRYIGTLQSITLDDGTEILASNFGGRLSYNCQYIFQDVQDQSAIYYAYTVEGNTVVSPIVSKSTITNVFTDTTEVYVIPTEPIGYAFNGSANYANSATTVETLQWVQIPVQPDSRISYDSDNSKIQIKDEFGNVTSEISAAAFIKDGILENVELYQVAEQGVSVDVPYLKFTFNTDSGAQPIRVSLKDIGSAQGCLKQIENLSTYNGRNNEIVQYVSVSGGSTGYKQGFNYICTEAFHLNDGETAIVIDSVNGIYQKLPCQLLLYRELNGGCEGVLHYPPQVGEKYYDFDNATSFDITSVTQNNGGEGYIIQPNNKIVQEYPCNVIVYKCVGGNPSNRKLYIGKIGGTPTQYGEVSGFGSLGYGTGAFFDGAYDSSTHELSISSNSIQLRQGDFGIRQIVGEQNACIWKEIEDTEAIVKFTPDSGTFSDVPTAADLPQSGQTLAQLITRIEKIERSLKKVAFSNSYNDLNYSSRFQLKCNDNYVGQNSGTIYIFVPKQNLNYYRCAAILVMNVGNSDGFGILKITKSDNWSASYYSLSGDNVISPWVDLTLSTKSDLCIGIVSTVSGNNKLNFLPLAGFTISNIVTYNY